VADPSALDIGLPDGPEVILEDEPCYGLRSGPSENLRIERARIDVDGTGRWMASHDRRSRDMSNADTDSAITALWDQHMASEFAAHSADDALATMTDDPSVNMVPLVIGGIGRDAVHAYYSRHFVSQIPPDMEIVPVSRTVGQGRIVDEMVASFTHTIELDWLLPGIPPTGKRVALPLVAIVQFEDGKIAHEHLYWDQASVLVQVGLIDRSLPVMGAESAEHLLNPTDTMNELIRRAATR
jgi:carboxymethylenebutenolidase